MIDPRVAWRIDGRTLLTLCHGMDQSLLEEVRRIIAESIQQQRCDTWQEALNAASGAQPRTPGRLDFWANNRCSECNGRRFSRRTGQVCFACMGRGRRRERVRVTVLWASS